MTTIFTNYRITTPIFCGGVGQKAEFRLSIGNYSISVVERIVRLKTDPFWKPVTDFLDLLLDVKLRKEFSSRNRIEEVACG